MGNYIEDLFDEDVENSIIAIGLTHKDKVSAIVATLTPEDFYQRINRAIFLAISELYNEGKEVDIITVSNLLKFKNTGDSIGCKKIREAVNDLAIEVPSIFNLESLFKIIIKYSKKRKVLELCRDTISRLEQRQDVDTVTDKLIITSQDILTRSAQPQFTSLEQSFDEFFNDVELLYNSETGTLGLPTGIKALDNNLSGLVGGKLYILGARPAMGKSLLAQQIAEYIATNNTVLFFSLEMSSKEYASRSCYRHTGINQDYLTRGNEEQKEMALEKVVKSREYMSSSKLKLVADPECNLLTIEKNILQCKRLYGECSCIVIDYLQLMSGNSNQMDDYKRVTDNSRGLKKLSLKYNIPIIALCQLSRQLETRMDKRPMLSDLRDSGAIEQDADAVIFLYRDYYYNKNPGNKDKAELLVAKNRSGRTENINLLFYNGVFREPMR